MFKLKKMITNSKTKIDTLKIEPQEFSRALSNNAIIDSSTGYEMILTHNQNLMQENKRLEKIQINILNEINHLKQKLTGFEIFTAQSNRLNETTALSSQKRVNSYFIKLKSKFFILKFYSFKKLDHAEQYDEISALKINKTTKRNRINFSDKNDKKSFYRNANQYFSDPRKLT